MGILNVFNGYAVHDHWASYNRFDCYHVLCNAHYLRELIQRTEQHDQKWASMMVDCLLDATADVDAARVAGKRALAASLIDYYDKRLIRILSNGRDELPIIAKPKIKK